MNHQDIINLRLSGLQISNTQFFKPEELVSYLGAVQSQDFAGAKWALGLRLPGSVEQDIEKAFNDGKILRTHALRPTWHFVSPEDIRWMVELNASQVKRLMGHYNHQLELNEDIFKKSQEIITKSLQGKNLTRTQISAELKKHGITGTGQRIGHIIMWTELNGLICSGPRIGKQFSYALIEDVAPKVKKISWDEALVKLTKLFYTTRGPATIKDFSKWSGLSQADIKKGIGMVSPKLLSEEVDGKTYWFSSSTIHPLPPTTHLLPNYDEYISSYADYSLIADLSIAKNLELKGNALFWNHIVINGTLKGSWRRVFKKDTVEIQISAYDNFTKEEKVSIEKATIDYGKFWGLKVKLI